MKKRNLNRAMAWNRSTPLRMPYWDNQRYSLHNGFNPLKRRLRSKLPWVNDLGLYDSPSHNSVTNHDFVKSGIYGSVKLEICWMSNKKCFLDMPPKVVLESGPKLIRQLVLRAPQGKNDRMNKAILLDKSPSGT